MKKEYLITFENTHQAISAEDMLNKENIKNRVMPTPTNITKSCGISIKIEEEQYVIVNNLIFMDKLKFKNVYLRCNGNYEIINLMR